MKNTDISIELEDIQGLVVRGYKRMQFAVYLMLSITDAAKMKIWMRDIADELTNAERHEKVNCLNFAITYPGFEKLGLHPQNLDNFSQEFCDGMNNPHRSRLLGDVGSNAPENWTWGHENESGIHCMLMLFGATKEALDSFTAKHTERLKNSGLSILHTLDGQTLPQNREHFGFRDGISQPTISGSGRTADEMNMIEPGEFILGYKNEYGVFPESPLIEIPQGNVNLLAEDADGSGLKDLGRNGSYLVFRQIQEHVEKFWTFINERSSGPQDALKLASKMMGRWPSGAPLVRFPDADPGGNTDENDFGYSDDKDGLKCPFGSHIRRTNPRDDFEHGSAHGSLRITKRHRIIRRARLYGDPYEGSPENFTPEGEVGLQFICFQSNIGKQFEFIQHTWCNYPNFMDLYDDPDPFIGVRDEALPGYTQNFTIQQQPVSRTIKGLQNFTRIRGGAYFFFPGIAAVRYLSSL